MRMSLGWVDTVFLYAVMNSGATLGFKKLPSSRTFVCTFGASFRKLLESA